MKPEARNLGFDTQTLAYQIGNSFGGAEVQKIRRDGAEIRVVVQNARSARDTIEDLMQSRLRSKDGKWIPLQSVADVKGRYVSGETNRVNGKLAQYGVGNNQPVESCTGGDQSGRF